jgi:hypothetical protein
MCDLDVFLSFDLLTLKEVNLDVCGVIGIMQYPCIHPTNPHKKNSPSSVVHFSSFPLRTSLFIRLMYKQLQITLSIRTISRHLNVGTLISNSNYRRNLR